MSDIKKIKLNGVVYYISAEYAEKLRYLQNGSTIEIDPADIALKSEVSIAPEANVFATATVTV